MLIVYILIIQPFIHDCIEVYFILCINNSILYSNYTYSNYLNLIDNYILDISVLNTSEISCNIGSYGTISINHLIIRTHSSYRMYIYIYGDIHINKINFINNLYSSKVPRVIFRIYGNAIINSSISNIDCLELWTTNNQIININGDILVNSLESSGNINVNNIKLTGLQSVEY